MIKDTIIITGEKGSGKTTFTKEIVESLKQNNIQVAGILALGYWENNQRDRYELIDISTNKSLLFCQRSARMSWEKIRQFYINPDGQEFGESALSQENIFKSDVVVIDEIGPFELSGKGWDKQVRHLLRNSSPLKILVIRSVLVREIIQYYQIKDFVLYRAGINNISEVVDGIITQKP